MAFKFRKKIISSRIDFLKNHSEPEEQKRQ